MTTSNDTETGRLEETIDSLMTELAGYDGDSEEYAKIVKQLTALHALKQAEDKFNLDWFEAQEKQKDNTSNREAQAAETASKWNALKHFKRPSTDTMLIVGANILGILIIVGHERANVVTSKALSFLRQPK